MLLVEVLAHSYTACADKATVAILALSPVAAATHLLGSSRALVLRSVK
jgi:hypothetical protein